MSKLIRVVGIIVVCAICIQAYLHVKDSPLLLYSDESDVNYIGLVYVKQEDKIFFFPFSPDQLRKIGGKWCVACDNGVTFELATYDDFTDDKVIYYSSILGSPEIDPRGRQPHEVYQPSGE